MTYGDRFKRWAAVRLLANMQRVTVARFVKELDADGLAQALRRLEPKSKFIIYLMQGVSKRVKAIADAGNRT